ncbi:MAG TPA: DUF1223 domain-containing protein [Rubricoccaceae bacterium]|nr:DUF1223 domain-containing protein [Rubricoccaceae bacterium]
MPLYAFLITAATLLALACGADALDPMPPPAATTATPVAVVELFTSEGCSSCPPADALLKELVAEDRAGVLALSFHVDYWDDLGWRDPFSSVAFSNRQRAYARARGDGRVYTPQMVLNGTTAFVGSRRAEARRHLDAALSHPAEVPVTLTVRRDGRALEATYAVTGAPEGAVLHLALVQRSADVRVGRGENGGRRLRHANVVRVFQTVDAGSGTATLRLPEGLEGANAAVAAYVQQGATGTVLGGAWSAPGA